MAPLRVAVLVSGTGSTLSDLAEDAPGVGARIVLVVADRPGIRALSVAAAHRIPTVVVPLRGIAASVVQRTLDASLRAAGAELVVLAGLRTILPAEWLSGWSGRVVNVHPALLPRHGGRGQFGTRVYESILASGDVESGATVHLVTADVDAGPTLLQERFPVLTGSTVEQLRTRTQALERRLLREGLARFSDGRWPLPYGPSPDRRVAGGGTTDRS